MALSKTRVLSSYLLSSMLFTDMSHSPKTYELSRTGSCPVNDVYTHCSKGSLRTTTTTRPARLARRNPSTHHMCANADNCPLQSAGRDNHRPRVTPPNIGGPAAFTQNFLFHGSCKEMIRWALKGYLRSGVAKDPDGGRGSSKRVEAVAVAYCLASRLQVKDTHDTPSQAKLNLCFLLCRARARSRD